MIEVRDEDLSAEPGAPMTISEAMDSLKSGLISPARGDLVFEWRNPDTLDLEGRVWAWRNGEGIERMYDFRGFLVRAVYYARPERLH
jgi:hypothetical protein